MSTALDDVGREIERLTAAPDTISAPLHRLFRGLFHRLRWRPKAKIRKVRALVNELEARRRSARGVRELRPALDDALEELRDNVRQVERATVIAKRPQVAHAAWLRRLYEVLVHAERAVVSSEPTPLAIAAAADNANMLPPLSMQGATEEPEDAEDEDAPVADPTRVLELQLDTIDHLLGAAREESAVLGRRRRLLLAARQLLLESSAALDLERDGVQQRLEYVAEQITRINRYEALGLAPDVALIHQARSALSRGDREKVFAALQVLRGSAAATADIAFTDLAAAALDRLGSGLAGEASTARSAQEVFGDQVLDAVHAGYVQGREWRNKEADGSVRDQVLEQTVIEYFAPGKERAALAHALAVDGCFDVGGTLSPVRVEEHYIRRRIVPYPTQRQALVQASGPQDIATAVIRDPRSVILDLAAGRLLARRFQRDEIATRRRTVMQGEVRIYVLDGSSSMIGPRARMRDAILVAELATLMRRLSDPGRNTRVVLFYRYFNREPGPVTRVDRPDRAIQAIHNVTATPQTGGTHIEAALLASMELIQSARREDPELARAQIVLVTDGKSPVSEDVINEAREAVGNLAVNISVIALGAENPALREIVARQRAQGERAFYHHLPDQFLERVSDGEVDAVGIHLPPVPRNPAEEAALDETLGKLIEDMVELQRDREGASLRELDRDDRDQRIERPALAAAEEGQRARLEALYRDDRGLDRRYTRWFPPAAATRPHETALARSTPEVGTVEREDIESMLVVLTTIAEVVETVGGNRLGRKADAVDVLCRLLPNARLTPARYHELLRSYPTELADALEALHGAVTSGLAWRIEEKNRARAL